MSTCRCTRRWAMSRWSHPSKPARRWPGPTPSPSSAGFVISRRRCTDRRERHPGNLSNGRAHYLWGRRYLLAVVEKDTKPFVRLSHRRITLTVRPGSTAAKREKVIHEWHKALLHEAVPPLVHKWEARLGIQVAGYFLQRMKTKWGGCNRRAGNIRLNTELVKKPKDLLEYVVVHEVLHLIEPTHSEHFMALQSKYYPTWREARAELNALPLSAEVWRVTGGEPRGGLDLHLSRTSPRGRR